MRISIVAVGRARALTSGIEDYERRASRYWRFESIEVPQPRERCGTPAPRGREHSARLRPRHLRVALTRAGRHFSSLELARWLERLSAGPEQGVHFIIGGAFGLDAKLLQECDLTLSLSPFTLPHDLARLVMAEQLYRAGTILRREPYHKGRD